MRITAFVSQVLERHVLNHDPGSDQKGSGGVSSMIRCSELLEIFSKIFFPSSSRQSVAVYLLLRNKSAASGLMKRTKKTIFGFPITLRKKSPVDAW